MIDFILGLIVIIGIGLFVASIWQFLQTKQFLGASVRSQATVIENRLVQSGNAKESSMMYQPVMKYQVSDKTLTFSPNYKSNPAAYQIDEQVAIAYNPTNPQDVRLLTYWGLYLASIILMAFALPMLVIAGGYFLFKFQLL